MPETDQARKGGRSSPQHPSRSAALKSLDLSLATRHKKFEMTPNCESQASVLDTCRTHPLKNGSRKFRKSDEHSGNPNCFALDCNDAEPLCRLRVLNLRDVIPAQSAAFPKKLLILQPSRF